MTSYIPIEVYYNLYTTGHLRKDNQYEIQQKG